MHMLLLTCVWAACALPLLPVVTSQQTSVTVLSRMDGSVDFRRNWTEYVQGFGDPTSGEFWLGLEPLHALTTSGSYGLRVNMETWTGDVSYAQYGTFHVAAATDDFRLLLTGYDWASSARNSLALSTNMRFSTHDRDNDMNCNADCAGDVMNGGWWYSNCGFANPTGLYLSERSTSRAGVTWYNPRDRWRSFKVMTLTAELH